MIRNIVLFVLLVPMLALAGLYIAYGEAAPCKALAEEKARRSALLPVQFFLAQTSQMSSTSCARELVKSWGERIEEDRRD